MLVICDLHVILKAITQPDIREFDSLVTKARHKALTGYL